MLFCLGKEQIEQVVSSTESIVSDPRFTNEAGFFDFGLFASSSSNHQ